MEERLEQRYCIAGTTARLHCVDFGVAHILSVKLFQEGVDPRTDIHARTVMEIMKRRAIIIIQRTNETRRTRRLYGSGIKHHLLYPCAVLVVVHVNELTPAQLFSTTRSEA